MDRARIAAKRRGDAKFVSVTPCRHGHTGERYVGSGECVVCNLAKRARQKKRRESLDKTPVEQVRWWEYFETAFNSTKGI